MTLSNLSLPVIITCCVLLQACSNKPIEQVKDDWVNVQSSWSQSQGADATLTSTLLALFDDAVMKSLVQQSQQKNLTLRQQEAATQSLAATVIQANGAFIPNVSTNLNSSRQENGGIISQSNSLSLDVSWEVDIWGKLANQLDSAQSSYQASKLTYQALKDSIAAQTMQAYIDAVSQAQLAKLSNEKQQSFEKTLNVVQYQFTAGTADLSELTQARQNLSSAQADFILADLSQRNAQRTLQVLVGDYPSALNLADNQLPKALTPPNAQVPAQVLARRPDVQSSWWSLQSRYSDVSAAKAARLPNINITTQLGESSSAFKDLLSGDLFWNLAASIGYTLFDSGALEAQVASAQSLREQSYYQYLETVLNALEEVESALDSETSYYEHEIKQTEVVKHANILLTTAEQDYRDGLLDITDWLTYQRSYFNEQSTLIGTVNQRLKNRVSLGLALGLGV